MKPRQATAYLKGIRAARGHDLRKEPRPPVCPYEHQALANYWRRGFRDYEDNREDAIFFLKCAEGGY